jgi:hypothetical protein
MVPSATNMNYALARGVGAPFTNQVEWKILGSVHEIIYFYPIAEATRFGSFWNCCLYKAEE